MKKLLRWTITVFGLLSMAPALAEENRTTLGQTPPRLSLIEGPVSFWRTGAEEWSTAALNTPMAPGDALFTGEDANLELQIGNRAFVRAGDETQISVVNIEPDYLQFRVSDGQVSFDLRTLPNGLVIEINTPNAAFTIERGGYYRLKVDKDTSSLITRRGGLAAVTPSGGMTLSVSSSEELIVEGNETPTVETYAAPELDSWDRWNYQRTDHLVDAVSSRYVSPEVYGAEGLDHYGDWRVEANYGPLWVPRGIASDWAPYSDGRWIWDPFYGWTWIDNAPWGWAPFHYGRWVHLNGYWAWAPGPMSTRTVYAPALVAFFGHRDDTSVNVSIGLPGLSWVALSWGEPLMPWWGRRGFVGVPWWGGWHGPRVKHEVTHITHVYHNTRVNHAVIGAPREEFGHGRIRARALDRSALRHLTPVRGAPPVRPGIHSVATGNPTDVRPTREVLSRRAITVRAPREVRVPWTAGKPKGTDFSRSAAAPELRFVPRPQREKVRQAPFGRQDGPERATPTEAPRFEGHRRNERSGASGTGTIDRRSAAPEVTAPTARPGEEPATPMRQEERRFRGPGATPPPELTLPPAQQFNRAPARRDEAATPQKGEDGRRAPHRTEPPESSGREAQSGDSRGRGQDWRQRESTRDSAQGLPGQPANRLSPKRRGPDDDEARERPDRGRRN